MCVSLQKTTCLFFLSDPRRLQRHSYWMGKKINLVKKHHGSSCDNNSKKGSCCTEKTTCCEGHELPRSLCSLEKLSLLLSIIRARTGHPHQPLHCLPPLGVPQPLAIDQGSRAGKENPLTCS